MAPPAVRIRMGKWFSVPEVAALLQRLFDSGIGVEDTQAAKQLDGVEEMPGRSDRREDLEPVLHPRGEVVGSMSWCRVNGAGPSLEGHVLRQHAERFPRIQRM